MLRTTTHVGWNFQNSYAHLPKFFFSMQEPTPVKSPEIVLFNRDLAKYLGLNSEILASKKGAAIFGGNQIPPDAAPLAQAYGGHQFGHFTMLGDGRALLLGEHISPAGERWDLQLKGSGPTPYSRGGDGRAALGPMLREYLISEAMFALGIPTTRSLAVVTTGEKVYRESALQGAILTRVAKSHLRVGTFQYAATWGTRKDLQILADYTINRHFPEIKGSDKYRLFLKEVIKAQAVLISQWMLVGFIHGVMNTDNMAISGETIDYGPCAFMDTFDPTTVFSSIDQQGRYAYVNQPKIALWNLARFAETLLPLLAEEMEEAMDLAQSELENFGELYNQTQLIGMGAKLGISNPKPGDEELFSELLQLMFEHKADYTNTFLDLTFNKNTQEVLNKASDFVDWKKRWEKRLEQQPNRGQAQGLMEQNNPGIIPRNYQVEKALRYVVQDGDLGLFNELLEILQKPFAHTPAQAEFNKPPPPSTKPYHTFCGT